MSNHLISTAYKRNLRTPMRKAAMALLADKASDNGAGIYASKQTMADELCCSKQAVIDTLKGFIAEGLLVEVGKRPAPNGYTVEYAIEVDALEALPLVKCHADRESRKASWTGQSGGPVNQVDRSIRPTPPVNHVDPNPPEPLLPVQATPSQEQREIIDRVSEAELVEAWNDAAVRHGLAKVRLPLSLERRRKAKALIRHRSLDDMREAFAAIGRSPFLRGETGNWRGAHFDFLLQPSSFQKMIEGVYDRATH